MEAVKEDPIFGPDDVQMLSHTLEVIRDRMAEQGDYSDDDRATVARLEGLLDDCRTERLICAVLVAVPVEIGEPDDETECRNRDGEAYPEHDYDDFQCSRCGAEPDDSTEQS